MYREVERAAEIFVVALRPFQLGRIGGDDASHFVLVANRHRRVDVVACAAADEKISDGAVGGVVAAVPAGGPADHAKGVVVAFADDVATGVSEQSYDVEVTGGGGPVHRVGIVALLTHVRVESAREFAWRACGASRDRVCPGASARPTASEKSHCRLRGRPSSRRPHRLR